MDLKVVYTTADVNEANLVRGLLDANGIETFLKDANIVRMSPFSPQVYGEAKIQVPADQEAQAREILKEYMSEAGLNPEAGKRITFYSPKVKWVFFAVAVGIVFTLIYSLIRVGG